MMATLDLASRVERMSAIARKILAPIRLRATRTGVRMGGCMAALLLAGAAVAGDPFDDARYAIGIKDNATALRLVDSGQFDINTQNNEGYTLLHFAADSNNLAIVDALLTRGADPTLKTSRGSTVLSFAMSTAVSARIKQALNANAPAEPAAPAKAPANNKPAKDAAASPAPKSPHAQLCASRHYASSALCSDSTCKMREYRKWQTCLKTGSYY